MLSAPRTALRFTFTVVNCPRTRTMDRRRRHKHGLGQETCDQWLREFGQVLICTSRWVQSMIVPSPSGATNISHLEENKKSTHNSECTVIRPVTRSNRRQTQVRGHYNFEAYPTTARRPKPASTLTTRQYCTRRRSGRSSGTRRTPRRL